MVFTQHSPSSHMPLRKHGRPQSMIGLPIHENNISSNVIHRSLRTRSSLPGSASLYGTELNRNISDSFVENFLTKDRRLLLKYEQINQEIDNRLRMTQQLAQLPEQEAHLRRVQTELHKLRRDSSINIHHEKELLSKLEKQANAHSDSLLRKIFSIRRSERKMKKLKALLSEELSDSVRVAEQLEQLEKQSNSLAMSSSSVFSSSDLGQSRIRGSTMEEDELLTHLEKEKDDILRSLCKSLTTPDAQDLHTRITVYASDIRRCEAIRKQITGCQALCRRALHLIRIAMGCIVAPMYSGSIREFIGTPYPMALEATRLIDTASIGIQPDTRRRYPSYVSQLISTKVPKFPHAVNEFARRARSNFDPTSSIARDAQRQIRTAEHIILLIQRIAIQKLEVIEEWLKQVETEYEQAELSHRKLEEMLQDRMRGLARQSMMMAA